MKRWQKITVCFLTAFLFTVALLYVTFANSFKHFFNKQFLTDFLKSMQDKDYQFVLASNYKTFLGQHFITGGIAVLVHDCDYRIQGADILITVEQELGIKSTWFLRPEAEYYTERLDWFIDVERIGWEIGLHYDCLSRCKGDLVLAQKMFVAQANYLRSFFNVSCTRYHGDSFNYNIGNRWLYSNSTSLWQNLGLTEVSGLEPEGFSYVSDVNNVWHCPDELGSFVLVNLHSDWWYYE